MSVSRTIAPEQFHDAAFDEQASGALLSEIAATIGARSYTAGWHYRDGTAATVQHSGWWSDEIMRHYDENFALTDVWNRAQIESWRAGEAVDLCDLVPDPMFEKSTLWNEFLRPIGDDTWRCLSVGADNQYGLGAVAFHRGKSERGFDEFSIALLSEHAPRLSRLLDLRGRLSAMEGLVGGLSSLLDVLGHAILLVTDGGRVLHANAAAEQLTRTSTEVSIKRGILLARCARADRELKQIIAGVAAGRDRSPAAIRLGADGGLEASLVPAPGPANRGRVVVIMTTHLTDPTLETRLRAVYGLTKAEAQLAVALGEGQDAAGIACDRRVAIGTVRLQIKTLASKIGCHRQVDIVRAVKRLPLFWRDDFAEGSWR